MKKNIADTIMFHLEHNLKDTPILQSELEAVLHDTYEYGVEMYRMEVFKLDEDSSDASTSNTSRTNHHRSTNRAERRKANFAHKGKDAARRGCDAKWRRYTTGKLFNFFYDGEVVEYHVAKCGLLEDDTPSMATIMEEVDNNLRLEEKVRKEDMLLDISNEQWEIVKKISQLQEKFDQLHEQALAIWNEIDNL